MPRRTLAFVVFALVVAAGCVRLGFWQLARLGERRGSNAAIAERLTAPAVPWGEAVRDSARARYRRVQLAGRYDYARELVLTSRGRSGAPGVHVLTPLLVAGSPPILVNRGWAYAADGMSVDLAAWHEGDSAIVDGFLEEFVVAAGMVSTTSQPRGVRRLVRDSIEARLGERVAPFIVVQRIGSEQRDTLQHLMRADPPALDEGSHRSYAVQWFAFALIALVGTAAVARRPRQPAPQASSGAR
ncbi:MAG: SURF1 family protein [Gemmatimonadetes bacterium]|nr:SURF1 family protein [Gemmatimonadota bacterium]